MMLTNRLLTKQVVDFIQGKIDPVHRPFAALAAELDCSEAEIVGIISDLKKRGIIRRFGAVLRHQQAGYICNAMVAWQAPEGREDALGEKMAAYPQVSHCYLRQVPGDFPYQLFTMIHARSEEELQDVVKAIATATDIHNYQVLHSVREFKKVSMHYEVEDWLAAGYKEEG
jgi:DNA-binding Lrp family transcriptional regulator